MQTLETPHPNPDLFSRWAAEPERAASPDQVLIDAVAAGVLNPTEADLIASTRLDAVPVSAWAARNATPRRTAYTLRTRAEDRLVAYLAEATTAPRQQHPPATGPLPPPEQRSHTVIKIGRDRPARLPMSTAIVGVTACV
jgi:hypothetical protein